jgi:hypothetical protein
LTISAFINIKPRGLLPVAWSAGSLHPLFEELLTREEKKFGRNHHETLGRWPTWE